MIDIVSKSISTSQSAKPGGRGYYILLFYLLWQSIMRDVGAGDTKRIRDAVFAWISRVTNVMSANNVTNKPFGEITSDMLNYWRTVRNNYG